MNIVKDKKYMMFLFLGIALRFFMMSLGHNFDWDSYCIVGEISANLRNVYAETDRYNYAIIFSCIQGLLYRIAQIKPEYFEMIYRVLMVSTLTLADLGITCYIAKNFSIKKSVIFFLNPVSVIITGFHNQFDNLAILSALLMNVFFNEEDGFNKRDICFVLIFTLSLMTKHILFLFPLFILFRENLIWKKKIVYALVPPFLFLISFLPFIIQNKEALRGVINNVFLYRSFNNAPLLNLFYNIVNFPDSLKLFVYIGLMGITAFMTRKYAFEKQLFLYFIAMIAFSSAIANQYLVIPMASLCVLNIGWGRYIYMVIMGAYLVLDNDGLGVLSKIQKVFPDLVGAVSNSIKTGGYIVAAWILFLVLLYELFRNTAVNTHDD